jgi:hypothetical protein
MQQLTARQMIKPAAVMGKRMSLRIVIAKTMEMCTATMTTLAMSIMAMRRTMMSMAAVDDLDITTHC